LKITSAQLTLSYLFRVLCAGTLGLFASDTTTHGQITYLVDFGGGGFSPDQTTSGLLATPSPDANGNYWNNSAGGNFGQPSNLGNLVNTANQAGGISLTWTNWGSGVASANMGVTNVPSASGLSSSLLNIETARNDSVYTQSTTTAARFDLAGLVGGQAYDFSIFASRTGTDIRRSIFSVIGSTTLNQTIQTTGTNLSGTGLNYNTTLWNFTITPDSAGKVAVEFLADGSLSSRFAYINAMSISTVPEPSAGTLLGLGLFVLTLARAVRRR
jgi:hypothetical protein